MQIIQRDRSDTVLNDYAVRPKPIKPDYDITQCILVPTVIVVETNMKLDQDHL